VVHAVDVLRVPLVRLADAARRACGKGLLSINLSILSINSSI
jgi:hypothetical protein